MVGNPTELMRAVLGTVSLNILLFGPPIRRLSNDPEERPLQDKRQDIYDALTAAGHYVSYAEDVVEPGFTTALPYATMLKEYDLVFSYVSSSTGVTEIEIIGSEAEVAEKSMIFLDDRQQGPTVDGMCNDAVNGGAFILDYSYPNDIVSCRLLGESLKRATNTQSKKHLI
jgi:hypothetical protein